MSSSEPEIAVDDPTAPAEDSPAVTSTRTVETIVLSLCLRWRRCSRSTTGEPEWAGKRKARAGYFPFYLSVVLAAASLFGLIGIFLSRAGSRRPLSRETNFAA